MKCIYFSVSVVEYAWNIWNRNVTLKNMFSENFFVNNDVG